MTTPGIIIAARSGSSRFPRKHLQPFRGTTVLRSCVDRCAATGLRVIVAAPDFDNDYYRVTEQGEIASYFCLEDDELERIGEADVLRRLVLAAESHDIDPVIRITGDCPLPEPALALEMLVDLAEKASTIERGGPEESRQRHVGRGKLLPRERLAQLLDTGAPFLEIGQFAAWDM